MWEMVFFSLGRADKGEGEVLMGSRVWQGEFSVKDLVCITWLVNHVLITRVFFSFRSGRGGVRQSAWAERAVGTGVLLRSRYCSSQCYAKAGCNRSKQGQHWSLTQILILTWIFVSNFNAGMDGYASQWSHWVYPVFFEKIINLSLQTHFSLST